MAIVKYLIDEKGVDVNQMDVPDGAQYSNHWGVPITYVARGGVPDEEDGEVEVVRWLLEKGANPHIKDCWDLSDAVGAAKHYGNHKVLRVLREWEEQHGKTDVKED
ncbi:MAG: hypothetical protein Q9191_008535 [Dirinaria sp. TL-2023a]